jgi:hypothetical protein
MKTTNLGMYLNAELLFICISNLQDKTYSIHLIEQYQKEVVNLGELNTFIC